MREQVRGPAAPVKAQHRPGAVPADGAQLRQQRLDLGGQRRGRLGQHHQQRIPAVIGDPGLLGRRAGELQPRDVHLLYLAGPEVGAGVPVDVQEPERARARRGVVPGDGQLPVRGLARDGELAELAADRLDLRRPVQAQHPAQRGRRDPGGALGARLAQQRQEHQQHQHRLQAVEPAAQPAVHVPGCLDQPGAGQGGQRQQQPGQRIPRSRGEHRRGALPEQPEPGQRPLAVPRHRVRQHRQLILRPGGLPAGAAVFPPSAPSGAPGAGRRAGTRPSAVRTANVDTPVAAAIAACDFPAAASSPILCVSSGVSFDGPLRPALARHQPGQPAAPVPVQPPPQRHDADPERVRDLLLRRRLQLRQLHRRQPAARLVPAVPAERHQAVHPHRAAAAAERLQPDPAGDLGRAVRDPRKRQLRQPARHLRLPEPPYDTP